MIGDTIRGYIESRSVLDLLLILAGFTITYYVYLWVGLGIVNRKLYCKSLVDGGFLAIMTLMFKSFIPIYLFPWLVAICFIVTFYRSLDMRLGWSVVATVVILFFSALSDFIVVAPILKIPGVAKWITKTSLGLAVSSQLEATITVVALFIYKAVKKCLITKIRCC